MSLLPNRSFYPSNEELLGLIEMAQQQKRDNPDQTVSIRVQSADIEITDVTSTPEEVRDAFVAAALQALMCQ